MLGSTANAGVNAQFNAQLVTCGAEYKMPGLMLNLMPGLMLNLMHSWLHVELNTKQV